MEYAKRIYDDVLRFRIESKGCVLIEGPKWCGKTTTAAQQAKSVLMMQDPESRQRNLMLAETTPGALLEGDTPRLIDEWQDAPVLWDAVRHEVDKRGDFGQFIMTGSTVPPSQSEIKHSGTGRIARMKMRTMSLFETGDSSGAVSMESLFSGEKLPVAEADATIDQLAFWVCRGGWPQALGRSERVALQQAIDYVDGVVNVDISRIDGVSRNPKAAAALLRSYARMVSTQGTIASVRNDMLSLSLGMGETTCSEYLSALQKLFVIDDLEAWNPNLRSKSAIRTTPTRHFADPSIAAVALGTSPSELLNDMNTFGLLFESLVVHDLRVYADALDGEVLHFRDRTGLETDAVVRLRNGSYGLVEVKLGGESAIEEAAVNLKRLRDKIDTEKMKAPSFMLVVVGLGQCSYVRKDGVLVVPVSCLGC